MLNVDNCPRCGKLYVKNPRGMCPACMKEIDQQCEECIQYLREHRNCTIQELSDATGVSIKQITLFIKEGRISIAEAPQMMYACEVCGAPIREHKMCEACRARLIKGIREVEEDERRKHETNSNNRMSYNIKDRLKDRLDR